MTDSGKVLNYLYLPYLCIVLGADIIAGLLNYLLFRPLLGLPIENVIIISVMILVFALLALYRPIVRKITSTWWDRGKDMPFDILFAIPALIALQLNAGTLWLAIAFIAGQLAWMICLFVSRPSEDLAELYAKLSREQLMKKVRSDLWKTFVYLVPSRNYMFTPVLVLTLTAIFMAMMLAGVNGITPTMADMIDWGSAEKVLLTGNASEHWRLVTASFIQGGFFQLLGTGICIVGSAGLLEKLIGGKAVVIIFVVSLVAASVNWYMFGSAGTFAGSHFAAMGFIGAMFFYALADIGTDDNRFRLIMSVVGFGLAAVLADATSSRLIGTINVAGLAGGFIGGIVAGIYYIPAMRRAKDIE
jgi:rhomboid protease GluP